MYEQFAGIYDELMQEIPYEQWFHKIQNYLCENGVPEGTICELGCGTGTMTELLAGAGYQMIGVDMAEDMLAIAWQKREESGHEILYLHQDMTELALAEPVEVMLSICDSMNYLTDETSLDKVLANVRKYLVNDGLFIFDLKTEYCFREVMGNTARVEETEEALCIWDNYYDETERINEYAVTIFQKCESSALYERFDELHCQRAYSLEEIRTHLKDNGFKVVECLDGTWEHTPDETSERITMIVRKMG